MSERMTGFTFRVRFQRSPSETINFRASTWEWKIDKNTPSLLLRAHKKDTNINDSEIWVFQSNGWPSEDEVHRASSLYLDVLTLTLVRLRIGADFGSRAPKSTLTRHGVALFEAQTGKRILNDVHGLMVYKSHPTPYFVSAKANCILGKPQDHFEKIFSHALASNRILTERERLSLELFNTSFFQKSNEARILLLVAAIEALLEPSPRSSAAASHVESMIAATSNSEILSSGEKDSLLGSLNWLRNESINKTGRKLAVDNLKDRTYMDKVAPSFFSYCYNLRSRLVHGTPPIPSQHEIGSVVAPLVEFVSDILSGELREVQLP
jgi:hypothetical protein